MFAIVVVIVVVVGYSPDNPLISFDFNALASIMLTDIVSAAG